jgi:hypothetical protein
MSRFLIESLPSERTASLSNNGIAYYDPVSQPKLLVAALDTDASSPLMSVARGSSSRTTNSWRFLRGVQWGLFDRLFKVKQLLQPSPNLDVFFIAALSKRATAMMSYR